MAVAEDHPSVEELAAFILGTLGEATQTSLEAHVAACTSCQERAVHTPGDSFVELLRSTLGCTSRRTDTFVDAASQMQTPLPLEALGVTDALALAASDGPEAPDAVPLALADHERYRVVRLVGAGGMGAVYEAKHRVMQRPVALKVIKRTYTASAAALERFRREVRAAARLSHPNIVATYDAEDAGETHFLVMEYVEGIDLGRLIQECGPLPVDRTCGYIRQAALGLQHAFEQGMVHRDLKPHNLMLTPDGRVKILDFGLARFASEAAGAAGLTSTGIVLGTVDYIAPEQADNAHQADIRSDIYSLGCTLYHLLAGQPPFPTGTSLQKVMAQVNEKPQPLTELRDDLPEGLMPVLERMMAKNPRHRYQTPAEVASALEPFAVATAITRAPRSRPRARATDDGRTVVLEKTLVDGRRQRLFVIATAIMLFLVAGLLGVAVYRIATDQGELLITTESDDVKLVITQGGKQVDVIDTKTDKQIRLALRSGEYELELKGAPEGLKLNIDKATLTRGKETLAKIERVEKKPAVQVGEIRRFGAGGHIVRRLALSPDGERLLTAEYDGCARYWDIATGKEIYRLPSNRGAVYTVAISPDGKKLLSGGQDRLIHVWDEATGKEVKQLKGHTDEVSDVAVSPDGRMVASSDYHCQLRLWNLDTGELTASPGGREGNGVAFSPDGKLIATWTKDHMVRLWDVKNQKEVRRLEGHREWVAAGAFSRDGSRLLTGTWPSDYSGPVDRPSELILWDVTTGKPLRTIDVTPRNVVGLAISPDGRRALSGGNAGLVELWDLQTGKQIIAFKGHAGAVYDVAFLPDGRTAVSVGEDGTIRLWRLPDLPAEKVGEVRRFEGHTERAWEVAFSPDGRYVLSGGADEVFLWEVATGREVRRFSSNDGALAFSPNGRQVLTAGGGKNVVRLWDVQTGKVIRELKGHTSFLNRVEFSPDGRRALSGSSDGTVRLWDLESGNELRRFPAGAVGVAFSSDGRRALSGGRWDSLVRLWDVETGAEVRQLRGHTGPVTDVVFLPGGRQALSCSHDQTLRLWDVDSGEEIRVFSGHTHFVQNLAITRDGRYAMSASADKTVRLWDLRTGKELHCFTGHTDDVLGVAISPDGKFGLSGSFDKTVRLWRLPDLSPSKKNP